MWDMIMYGCYLIIKLTSMCDKNTSMMQNIYLSYIQWHYKHFHMLYQRLAIYFLKAEYTVIQVMNSTVKDKWDQKQTNTKQNKPIKNIKQKEKNPTWMHLLSTWLITWKFYIHFVSIILNNECILFSKKTFR